MRATIILSPKQLWVAVGAVAAGGALGTLLRDLLTQLQSFPGPPVTGSVAYATVRTFPPDPFAALDWTKQVPWALLIINVVGVFVATRLLSGPLRSRDPNDPVRLLVITGFLGGFTSYSGLFVALGAIGHLSLAASLLIGVGAVVSGVLAAVLGLWRPLR